MKVHINYNVSQLEAAVDFVAKHNRSFAGMHTWIRDAILKMMRDMAADPEIIENGTMGFIIMTDIRVSEGIDSDTNYVSFEVLVDPNLGSDAYIGAEEVIDV
jgi:hypothetical protein